MILINSEAGLLTAVRYTKFGGQSYTVIKAKWIATVRQIVNGNSS